MEARFAEGKKEIAKVKAELWRKEGKLAVLGEFEEFLKEFAEEVGALVLWSNFKDFMEGRRMYWAEEWGVYWNTPGDDNEESDENSEEEGEESDEDAEVKNDEEE